MVKRDIIGYNKDIERGHGYYMGYWSGKGKTKVDKKTGEIIYQGTGQFYKRHCFSHEGEQADFTGFMGWKHFKGIIEENESPTKELVLTMFKCGGRANEILLAEGKHVKVKDKTVDVTSLPAFKKRHGQHWEDGQLLFRNFPVLLSEPLSDVWAEWLESKGNTERLFDFKYDNLYRLIVHATYKGKNANLFPHKGRAERASQLVEDYNANTFQLKEFFGWTRDETPNHYVKLGMKALKAMYGLKVAETEIEEESEKVVVPIIRTPIIRSIIKPGLSQSIIQETKEVNELPKNDSVPDLLSGEHELISEEPTEVKIKTSTVTRIKEEKIRKPKIVEKRVLQVEEQVDMKTSLLMWARQQQQQQKIEDKKKENRKS